MRLLRRTLNQLGLLSMLLVLAASSTSAQAVITIEPDTLDFFQVEGGAFADASFTITNVSSDTVTGDVQVSTGVFQAIQGGGDFTLAASDSISVIVRFTPSSARLFDDSLAISYDVGDSTYVSYVYMLGAGVEGDTVVVDVTPDMLDFGNVEVGQSASLTVSIINTSDSAQFIGLVADLTGAFTVTGGSRAITIDANDTLDLEVTFSPSELGAQGDTLVVTYVDGFAMATLNIPVVGVGVEASVDTVRVVVTPPDLDFGEVSVGATVFHTVYVTNASDSARLIGAVGSVGGGFTVVGGFGNFSLAAGETRAVTVAFTPTAAIAYSDSLAISFMGTGGLDTAWVGLSGQGTTSATVSVSVQPEIVLFGNVVVGESGQRTVTITNTSDAAIVTGVVAQAGAGTDFSVTSGIGAFTLSAGASHTIIVNYAPTSSGVAIDSLMIVFGGTTGLDAMNIPLIGFGVESSGGGQLIVVSPTTVGFGNVDVGTTTQLQFQITNGSSTDTLSGSVSNPVAPFYVNAAAGPFTLAPGDSRLVTVFFTPLAAGSFSDNLVINYTSGDSSGVALVRLTGSAVFTTGIRSERTPSSGLSIASYPEPTSGAAEIRYVTARSGHVRIAIYDTRGREVARPLDAIVEAGEHAVTWSAGGQPAGIYVVTVQTADDLTSSRITVVK